MYFAHSETTIEMQNGFNCFKEKSFLMHFSHSNTFRSDITISNHVNSSTFDVMHSWSSCAPCCLLSWNTYSQLCCLSLALAQALLQSKLSGQNLHWSFILPRVNKKQGLTISAMNWKKSRTVSASFYTGLLLQELETTAQTYTELFQCITTFPQEKWQSHSRGWAKPTRKDMNPLHLPQSTSPVQHSEVSAQLGKTI